MDRVNVVKCKSSNSAITTGKLPNSRVSRFAQKDGDGNQKSWSSAEIEEMRKIKAKRRGVYVEKRATKISLNAGAHTASDKAKVPGRRERTGFINNVYNVLSKETTSTQNPDNKEAKKRRVVVKKQRTNMQTRAQNTEEETKTNEPDGVEDQPVTTPAADGGEKPRKFKSKVLGPHMKPNATHKSVIVLQQAQKQMKPMVTSSLCCGKAQEVERPPHPRPTPAAKCQSGRKLDIIERNISNISNLSKQNSIKAMKDSKDSFKPILKRKTNSRIRVGSARSKNRVLKIEESELDTVVSEQPETLVNEKLDPGLYNFFVDLLETTFDMEKVNDHRSEITVTQEEIKEPKPAVITPKSIVKIAKPKTDVKIAKPKTDVKMAKPKPDVKIAKPKSEVKSVKIKEPEGKKVTIADEDTVDLQDDDDDEEYFRNDNEQDYRMLTWNDQYIKVVQRRPRYRNVEPPVVHYPKRRSVSTRTLRSISQVFNSKGSAKHNKKNRVRNAKLTLLKTLKEELRMDDDAFEEPDNLHDALYMIVKNRKRCRNPIVVSVVKTEENDKAECHFKRKKVISPSTKSKKKKIKRPKNYSIATSYMNANEKVSPNKNYNEYPSASEIESVESIQVVDYDIIGKQVKKINLKPKDVSAQKSYNSMKLKSESSKDIGPRTSFVSVASELSFSERVQKLFF